MKRRKTRRVRRNKMRGTRIRVRVSRPSYGKPFYGDIISVYRRTPGKEYDEGVYSSHHGRIDKGYLIQRSPTSGASWYTKEDFRLAKRRGLRRNPTETVYLTQVGRNLYVGNFHSPGGTPAFNHMPKNLSFWNKYAYEKNKKLVMSRHAYMARGLRRNGADHKRHRWQIFGYDVWGNAEDGWEVNNVLPGPVITMSYKAEYDAKTFDSAMARARVGLRWKLIDEGASDEDTIYFNTVSGKPLGEMRRVK